MWVERQGVMNLTKTIDDLYAEKVRLERVIASLEDLQRTASANRVLAPGRSKRRGRKSMGAEERQEVSDRMKRYWANRRGKQRKKTAETDARSVK